MYSRNNGHSLSSLIPAPASARAASLAAVLLLGACQSLQRIEIASPQVVEPEGVVILPPAMPETWERVVVSEAMVRADDVETIASEPPEGLLERPFVLRYVEATPAQVLRSLAQGAGLEYVGDAGALGGGAITMEMTFQTTTDVYEAIASIASVAGLETQWNGNRVAFVKLGAVDSVSRGWYIGAPGLSAALLDAINERYALDCVQDRLLICLGSPAGIRQAASLIGSLRNVSSQLPHAAFRNAGDVQGIVEALGLTSAATVTRVSADVVLVAAANNATLDIIRKAMETVASAGLCENRIYQPMTAPPAEIIRALTVVKENMCGEAMEIRGRLLLPVAAGHWSQVLNVIAAVDVPRPVAALRLHVVSVSEGQGAELIFRDIEAAIPTGRFMEALEFAGGRSRAVSVRSVDLTAQEEGRASSLTRQRLPGSTAVIDGTVLQGVDQRSFGLQASFTGAVTERAIIGKLSLTDSALSGADTTEINCEAPVDLVLGMAAKVCSFAEAGRSSELGVTGVRRDKGSSRTVIYLSADTGAIYLLDSIRTVMEGMGIR